MSLNHALLTSAGGLRTTQAGLALIAANVANAETPGYVRKSLSQTTIGAGAFVAGVRVAGVNRELDLFIQRQLRIEAAGGAYADLRAEFYQRLQLLFGQPGSDSALETRFNALTTSLQALSTSPESYAVRSNVLSAAQAVAQQLNAMSGDIQTLRADADTGLAGAVDAANEALSQIAGLNRQLASLGGGHASSAVLMDQRDRYIDQLAGLVDIRIAEGANNERLIFTASGLQLAGVEASRLEFQPRGTMTADAQWSADPAKSGLATITLVSGGTRFDLLANRSIRSGAIAGLVEMRDQVLVQAQAQLDALAAGMSQALSDRVTAGTPVTVGAQNGFDLDLSGLLAGNSVRVSYLDVTSGTQKTVTLMRVDDPLALPLSDAATADPDDRVVGINFSGGMASIVAQVTAALGAGFTASNPAGSTLRILDDSGVTVGLTSASTTKTTTSLASGNVELALFTDGAVPYTGAITAQGSQRTGLAARIAINAAVLNDPAKLVAYATLPPTAAGDAARPTFLYDQITRASLTLAPESGVGSAASPFQGSLPSFLRQVLFQQGEAASAALNLQQGQAVVVDSLQQRLNEKSGVNIDQEMAHLLQLQSAYGANARVLSTVKEMLELLMRM